MIVQNRIQELIYEKQAREKREVSPEEVANAAGMSRQNLYHWIKNDVKTFPAKTLSAFCAYFPCQISELLVLVEDRSTEAQQ